MTAFLTLCQMLEKAGIKFEIQGEDDGANSWRSVTIFSDFDDEGETLCGFTTWTFDADENLKRVDSAEVL